MVIGFVTVVNWANSKVLKKEKGKNKI